MRKKNEVILKMMVMNVYDVIVVPFVNRKADG